MEWGTPVWWGKFLLFCVPQSVKTKETNPTRPGSPTPCKQALRVRPCVMGVSNGGIKGMSPGSPDPFSSPAQSTTRLALLGDFSVLPFFAFILYENWSRARYPPPSSTQASLCCCVHLLSTCFFRFYVVSHQRESPKRSRKTRVS